MQLHPAVIDIDLPIIVNELLPQFKAKSEETDWDTGLFDTWLKNAKLPAGAKEKIAEMTKKVSETFRVK